MSRKGLGASIWAPKGDPSTHFIRYVSIAEDEGNHSSGNNDTLGSGDWICYFCNAINFQGRTACFRCSVPASRSRSAQNEPAKGMNQAQIISTFPVTANDKKRSRGLSGSRWSSNNSQDGKTYSSMASTRRNPKSAPSVSIDAPTTTTVDLDLGLPYEVQHCILSIMQRILEEGCYEFASRWLPNLLVENNWTCAEAVELSRWRGLLPGAIQAGSLAPAKNYSLETALKDAVAIRNSAVHRHLCTNEEIREMALKAEKLMTMFSDIAREYKFNLLRSELRAWEASGKANEQAAKDRLQQTLQEIAERPVNDMDWTPNSVSLQEVSEGTDSHAEEMGAVDEMELDDW